MNTTATLRAKIAILEVAQVLIGMLAVVASVIAVAAIIWALVSGVNKEAAENAARQFASEMGWGEVIGVSAAGTDSDGDGYVSVSIRTLEPAMYTREEPADFKPVEHDLECGSGGFNFHTWRPAYGCRAARTKVINSGY